MSALTRDVNTLVKTTPDFISILVLFYSPTCLACIPPSRLNESLAPSSTNDREMRGRTSIWLSEAYRTVRTYRNDIYRVQFRMLVFRFGTHGAYQETLACTYVRSDRHAGTSEGGS